MPNLFVQHSKAFSNLALLVRNLKDLLGGGVIFPLQAAFEFYFQPSWNKQKAKDDIIISSMTSMWVVSVSLNLYQITNERIPFLLPKLTVSCLKFCKVCQFATLLAFLPLGDAYSNFLTFLLNLRVGRLSNILLLECFILNETFTFEQ